MKNFLQLCVDFARESGAVSRAPASVIGQTGRQEKVVNWIREAWVEIQNTEPNWFFLRGEWQGEMTIGAPTYMGASFSIDRFAEWIGDYADYRPTTLYDPAIGANDENFIRQISYERWKNSYDRGPQLLQRPTEYTLAPDGSIRFGARPDKGYVVRGEYRKSPQVLEDNLDIPDFPERFEMIIVWRAIILMGDHDEAGNAIARATLKYQQMLTAMRRDLLPSFGTDGAGPLA